MRLLPSVFALTAVLLGAARSGAAQTTEAPGRSLSPDFVRDDVQQRDPLEPSDGAAAQQAKELERWMRDFEEWKQWWAKWANRREPGLFSSSRPRRQKPAPPEWLAARCEGFGAADDLLIRACALFSEWRQDDLLARSRATTNAVVQNEETRKKTIWWERIHLDVLWPAAQLRTSVFGVIGVHTAASIRGRLQVFLAPGVMLLNLPATDGTRIWEVAANYGIGCRLTDFSIPGKRRASLHVNIAKSWLITDPQDLVVAKNVDFVGFSMTFNRR